MPTHRMTTAIFSAAYWEEKNPILLRGERGIAEFYDADGRVMRLREKVGDGVMDADRNITGTRWNDLPWFGGGEQGPKGDTGPMPRHDWKGTALRFQNPDNTWGERVDLKGEPGNRANAEPATTTILGGVMPATGLRVDVEGYEYVALGWSNDLCYPDPILVAHNGSAWLWLQESGVGTKAGVREPGTDDAKNYWQKIANTTDIPGPGVGLQYDEQANVYDVKYGKTVGTALEGNDTAVAATKLETARNIQVNLGSVVGANFDGTQDVKPGISGILSVSNGGTGVNNLQALKQQLGAGSRLVFSAAYEGGNRGGYFMKITGLTPGKRLVAIGFSDRNDGEWDNGFKGYGFTSCIYSQVSGLMCGTNLLPENLKGDYGASWLGMAAAEMISQFDTAAANGWREETNGQSMRISRIFHQLSVLSTKAGGDLPCLIAAPTVRLIAISASDWGGYFRIYEI